MLPNIQLPLLYQKKYLTLLAKMIQYPVSANKARVIIKAYKAAPFTLILLFTFAIISYYGICISMTFPRG